MAKKTDDKLKTILVPVDASKLSQGLKAAFMGIAMVFDSIGVGEAALELKAAAGEVSCSTDEAETRQGDTDGADIVESTGSDEIGSENKSDAAVETSDTGQAAPAAVTVDDITKVIVAKIKQKRINNEKIGQLLKTYGVDKVSSLPAEKYEAFLTDISQL